jgi:putative ABC transport system permease protein
VVILGLSVALWLLRRRLPLHQNDSGAVAMLGLLVGSSLAVPIAVRAFARSLEPVLGRVLGAPGAIASRNIVSHMGRVTVTCTAFFVSLTGAIAIATWLSSFERTLGLWLDSLFSNIDLVITSGAEPLSQESTPLPGSLATEIAAMPEVERVDTVRMVRIAFRDSLTVLIATDAHLYAQGHRELVLLEGDESATIEAMARGDGLVVNEAFQRRFHVRRGEVLSLSTPSGEARLAVLAVYFDPTFADLGTIHLDQALYRRLWRDETVNFVEPVLRADADRERVIGEIRRRWGDRHDLFIATIEEFRGEADELLQQTIALAYPMIAMAIAIALLGVVNSLLASVLDRIREIGVLRAVGATRGQVVRVVMIESATIGLMGGVLAAVVGSLFGYTQLEILFRGMLGMTVFYRHPTFAVCFALFAAVVLAALAGYLPGRSAGRLSVTEALEY